MEEEMPGTRERQSLPAIRALFSLGTSNRSPEEFTRILRAYGIEMVVDVRSFPQSRFIHFRQEALRQSLAEQGWGYYFLGKELGGHRREGYEAYTQTLQYIAGIELLERMASRCRSVFLCAERLPWKCHRRFIGRSLQDRGWEVIHIIDEEKAWKDAVPKEERNAV